MNAQIHELAATVPVHSWLKSLNVAFVPGPDAPALTELTEGLLRHFRLDGHCVQDLPQHDTDLILTTARFGEPTVWREALLFSARRRFKIARAHAVYTLVRIHPAQLAQELARLTEILKKAPPDPRDYAFPGLSPRAHHVLFEQGRRGGPLLALERMVQAQTKSIHILLVVGDERPERVYHFDLVGAFPKSIARDVEGFYEDIVLRIVTTLSTHEVTHHQVVGEPILHSVWTNLDTPPAMAAAGRELGKRSFFTEMVRVADLAQVPAVNEAVASQYSEGCFATWDPKLEALVATVTGSARPVDKGQITDDELAVIVGVRSDGLGALVRHVQDKRNDPPSSESVEMLDLDSALPRIALDRSWNIPAGVPVVRSKLHGHRAIAAFDPSLVEFVPLDAPYYYYLVTCGSNAQAQAIKAAFARSRALQYPDDPRRIVFTVLPGHGVVIAEKWVAAKRPFEIVWQAMDTGVLQIASRIPQGPMSFVPGPGGRMVLQAEDDRNLSFGE